MAQQTPSWGNTQSWHVAITSGEGTERLRRKLWVHASSNPPDEPDFPFPREYRGLYQARRRQSGYQLYSALSISREDISGRNRQSLENFRFFGAPHVAIITTDEALGAYGAIDCGGFVGNFLLAAQANGVAAIAQAALAQYAGFVRRELEIGDDKRMVCAISFGFPDEAHPANSYRTGRAPIDELVRWIRE